LQSGERGGVGILLRLLEEAGPQNKPAFKQAWQEFLAQMNVLQFASNAEFVTSQGLQDGEYGSLLDDFPPLRKEETRSDDKKLDELLVYVDERLRGLVGEVGDQGLSLPVAGFELVDDEGTVIGAAELGWEEKRVAVVPSLDADSTEAFNRSGWTTFSIDDAIKDSGQVIAALK